MLSELRAGHLLKPSLLVWSTFSHLIPPYQDLHVVVVGGRKGPEQSSWTQIGKNSKADYRPHDVRTRQCLSHPIWKPWCLTVVVANHKYIGSAIAPITFLTTCLAVFCK